MLPHSSARRPAATSIACNIDVVVVLPLVPVTTSQRRGGRQAGAGDDEVELGDLFGGVGWIDHCDTVLREGRQRGRAVVGERGTRAERRQRGKNGATGDARTGDQDGGS